MTLAIRLLFDDCLSKHAVKALQVLTQFTGGLVEVAHLADYSLSGLADEEWLPQIADGGWIVVSTDRGKKPTRGGKLPLVCQKLSITYVLLSGTVHKRNTFDKIRAIFGVWPQLHQAAIEARGHGYLLRSTGNSDRVTLDCVYSPAGDEGKAKVQQMLAICTTTNPKQT